MAALAHSLARFLDTAHTDWSLGVPGASTSSPVLEMTASLHPRPASVGGAADDGYCAPPPQGQGKGPPKPQAVGATAAEARSSTTAPTPPSPPSNSPGPSASAASKFPLFGQLPAEIRLQIWRAALPPRTVELHSGRYSSHYARSAPAPWHSSSGNPAPLAACAEARLEGLRRYYTVALAVVPPAGSCDLDGKPAAAAPAAERRLYLDPERDTLVVLGALEHGRLAALGAGVARQDSRGLRRLALTTGGFARDSAGPELRIWARAGLPLLAGLDQFTLLLHDARWPPNAPALALAPVLRPCAPDDPRYAAFATSHRQHLATGPAWIPVGARRRPMRVARLEFVGADGVPVD